LAGAADEEEVEEEAEEEEAAAAAAAAAPDSFFSKRFSPMRGKRGLPDVIGVPALRLPQPLFKSSTSQRY